MSSRRYIEITPHTRSSSIESERSGGNGPGSRRQSLSRQYVEITPHSRSNSSSRLRGRESPASDDDQALSLNIWGRGDTGPQRPGAHWGLTTSSRGSTQGDLFHVRKAANNSDFQYERKRFPLGSKSSYGRSELTRLSRSGRQRAAKVLDEYGENVDNLPVDGANCRDWVLGSVGALEDANIVPRGTREYWMDNRELPSREVAARLKKDGRSWIPRRGADAQYTGKIDAKFESRRPTMRTPGKLDMSKFSHLFK
ncbi:predicted protein [Uncinocarpus reesii 1704]|uniref:Uncharacterized protein n=1 Tax=Uncinocarpus reesii (strain UAMH 1704) TaxID=336963 RepID=C4JVK5_UNCRE|nr:uncharacterized protein UREG_06597 [Uncinocarpus reesii 1704]EEP81732.1 predicted protein [Uncinocarpus reesii 1704]